MRSYYIGPGKEFSLNAESSAGQHYSEASYTHIAIIFSLENVLQHQIAKCHLSQPAPVQSYKEF